MTAQSLRLGTSFFNIFLNTFFICLVVSFLNGNDLLFSHGAHDGQQQRLSVFELVDDLLAQLLTGTRRISGQVQVLLGLTTLRENRDGSRVGIDIQQGKLQASDVRDFHVVGGRAHIFVLLAGEDIDTSDVGLGVAVLSGLGNGDLHDLARESLQQAVAALLQGTSLQREDVGATGIGALELMIVRHYEGFKKPRKTLYKRRYLRVEFKKLLP